MRREAGLPATSFDLSPLFAAEMARLRHALDGASASADPGATEEAVHAARRALKTLRALLRVLGRPDADPRLVTVDDALRNLAGSLSRTRDLHVSAATVLRLRRRLRADRGQRAGRKALRRHLAALATQWNDRAGAVERGRLRGRGDRPALEVIERMLDDLAPTLTPAELARAMARSYAKARDALAEALAGDDPEVLHGARSQVVRHQLQMKLLASLTGRGKRRVGELGRLREWLGRHHDLSVAETLAGETPRAPGLAAGMAELVRSEQAALVARCRPVALALFRRKPEAVRERFETRLAGALDRLQRRPPA